MLFDKEFDIYQVDAFAQRRFEGNPAAVVPLQAWPDDNVLQSIAAENNLSETAFFVPEPDGAYHLRWFTPALEVPLCGHATLAVAHVIYHELGETPEQVNFYTRSGLLSVRPDGGGFVMDFPADPPQACETPAELAEALGAAPVSVLSGQYLLAVYDAASDVAALDPDMSLLKKMAQQRRALSGCVVVSAPGGRDRDGQSVDFISRFFAPAEGIPEDPVTGSAHCMLAPYWAERLGKADLIAYQSSARGGRIGCRLLGDRVELRGQAVTYLRGRIEV